MAEYDIRGLHVALFHYLHHTRPDFTPFEYMRKIVWMGNNVAKVDFVWADLKRANLLPKLTRDAKNDAEAVACRESGNKSFSLGCYQEALRLYTRSLCRAFSSDKLALAYANRSAALFKLELYQQCLTDIERALALAYPDNLRPKLTARREQALLLMKPHQAVYEPVPEIPAERRNPLIPCASDAVMIEENGECGRHVVATRTIEVGEVISVEPAYASMSYNERYTRCHACLIICYNPIPCGGCTMACFCSERCKLAAAFYHQYECPILLSLSRRRLDSIAVRTIILARNDLIAQQAPFRFDKMAEYRSDRFKEIHCLRASRGLFFDVELFFDALKGAVIFELFKHTEFFKWNKRLEDQFKDEICHLMRALVVNVTKITEYGPSVVGYDIHSFGEGVYSFLSLFNHSCCNNVMRTHHGSTCVLRAKRTIMQGEQCLICYGSHYSTSSRVVRQTTLKDDYGFDCRCQACVEDWKVTEKGVGKKIMLIGAPPRRVDPGRGRMYYSPGDLGMLVKKMSSGFDMELVQQILPKLISQLRRREHMEPSCEVLTLQKLIAGCYSVFGNKRKL